MFTGMPGSHHLSLPCCERELFLMGQTMQQKKPLKLICGGTPVHGLYFVEGHVGVYSDPDTLKLLFFVAY